MKNTFTMEAKVISKPRKGKIKGGCAQRFYAESIVPGGVFNVEVIASKSCAAVPIIKGANVLIREAAPFIGREPQVSFCLEVKEDGQLRVISIDEGKVNADSLF